MLDVLSVVVRQTDGRVWFSKDLAGWVARVREAAPAMPPEWVHLVAHGYQQSQANKRATRGLDLTLALQPWRDQHAAIAWADRLREIGDEVGDWPGGGPGIMALAARLPPPDWTTFRGSERPWGGLLWRVLTEGIKAAMATNEDAEMDEDRKRRLEDLRRELEAEAVELPAEAADDSGTPLLDRE